MNQDPVWNRPQPITINGKEVAFKELPFLVLRAHMEKLLGLLLTADKAHPGLLDSSMVETSTVLTILLEEAMLGRSIDAVEAVARESTGLDDLGSLAASAWMEVVSRALEAQLPLVHAFLASGARWRAALPGLGRKRDGATLNSSQPSPVEASVG